MEKWMIAAKRADFQAIAQRFGIDQVTARLIRNRDVVGDEAIHEYLHGTREQMHSPWLMKDMEKTMLSLLEPEIKEVALGKAEIRQVFTIGKTIKIAGCYVNEGKINRANTAKIKRDGKIIFTGNIDQLKRFKDDVKEVAQGYECGISFVKFNDVEVGDVVEFTTTKEIERTELE